MLEYSEAMNVMETLNDKTKTTLDKLHSIWNEIGLDENTKEERHKMFIKYIDDLYNDIITDAEESRNEIRLNIAEMVQELCGMKRDLQLNFTIDSYENETLMSTKTKLKEELNKYKKMYDNRIQEINSLLSKEKKLCDCLGKKPKELAKSPLPSAEEVSDFRTYLEDLTDIKFCREEEFLNLKSKIVKIMQELEIKPSLDFERKIVERDDSAFKVTDENMKQLHDLHKSLDTQLEETKSNICELRERVANLWEKLEESPQIRSDFLKAHQGNSISTMVALKQELYRLEEKKKANIKLFVDKLRQELLDWWNKCYTSVEERSAFQHFDSDCYTEDLLALYELQIDLLKSHYEKNIAIYNLYIKRNILWEKKVNLEHRANQPNRFKNRGGQLLNEERERKEVNVQLPKIENELLDLAKKYETVNCIPFKINGRSLEDIFKEDWEEHKADKKLQSSAKKQLRDQTPARVTKNGNTRAQTPARVNKNGNTLITPSMTTSKRKLYATPMSEVSKRSRIDSTSKSSLKIPPAANSTNKAKSLDRQRRLQNIRKRSLIKTANETSYENFEGGLATKESCRSSLFPDRLLRSKSKDLLHVAGNTPQKVLGNVNSQTSRTPARSGLRSKSPTMLTPRLAALPNNLPIII